MPQMKGRLFALIPTMVAAATGTALMVLLIGFSWPRPVLDWMRVIVSHGNPLPASVLAFQLVRFAAIAMPLLFIAMTLIRWAARRLPITSPAAIIATILVAIFVFTFAFEMSSQIARASGSLTASDAGGDLFDEGRLTFHGWETIARRALTAAFYAGLMIVAFATSQSMLAKRAG